MTKFLISVIAIAALPNTVLATETQCRLSGHTRLWAQHVAGTDLAQAFLLEKKIPRVTKIGVIDSGFDQSQLSSLNQENELKIVPLNATAQSDPADLVGHGTIVLGLIKGKNGLGGSSYSPVTIYANGQENTHEQTIEAAVLRACMDGANVISLSMGTDMGIASFVALPHSMTFDKATVRELEKWGCILVHSAGNDHALVRVQNLEFEFEIGATSPLSQTASFSSPGEFQMPGQRVTSLRSTGQSTMLGGVNCGPSPNEALASGTSFSAPLFTDHLALSRDVLMMAPDFQGMGKSQQIQFLRELTQLSLIGNIVNSYLAVRIAFEWTANPRLTLSEAKIQLSHYCDPSVQEKDLRIHSLLCDDQTTRVRLASQLEKSGDLEGAAYWLNAASNKDHRPRLNEPFPIINFRRDLARGSNLPLVARWVNYYLFRQSFSRSDDGTARTELSRAARTALSNFAEITPQLRSPDFSREFESLTLYVLKENHDAEFLRGLVSALRIDKYSRGTLVGLFLRGSREKTITDSDIIQLIDALIGPSHSDEDMRSAITLLKYARLNYDVESSYLNKILAGGNFPREIFHDLSLIGIETDAPSSVEIQHWITTLKTLINNKNCGPKEADDLATALFAAPEIFAKANRADADEILRVFDIKLPTDSNSTGRALINYVKSKINRN